MKLQLEHNAHVYSLNLAQSGKTNVVTLDGQSYIVEILRAGEGWLDLRFSDSSAADSASQSAPLSAVISVDGPKRWVTINGQTFVLTQSSSAAKRTGAHHAAGELRAPMPGQIRAVQVLEGQTVAQGQTLVVVEAMKMELKVAAPFEGTVKTVRVQPGQTVEKDELLIELESKMSKNER